MTGVQFQAQSDEVAELRASKVSNLVALEVLISGELKVTTSGLL